MDQVIIDDLKQFIEATMAQQLSDVVRKSDLDHALQDFVHKVYLRANFTTLKKDIEAKLDATTSAIADAITAANDEQGRQYTGYDRRLTNLEKRAAH